MKWTLSYTKELGSTLNLLLLVILFTNCAAYESDTISLNEAVESEERIRITTKSGKRYKYRNIVKENDTYYGAKQKHGKIKLEELDNSNIVEINLYSEAKSVLKTILYFFLTLPLTGALIYIIGN